MSPPRPRTLPASVPPSRPSVLGSAVRTAAELAAELRREFERAMVERHGQSAPPDPVLAALFQATAGQMARVYLEAEQVFPEAVFDDLVSGLGMAPRAAQPAQTVVAVAGVTQPELLTRDVPLLGTNPQGEPITFTADVPVRLAPTTLAFAGVVDHGFLHVVSGAQVPAAAGQSSVPLLPTRAALAPTAARMAPTILLAFDAPDDVHLSGAGLFIEVVGIGGGAVADALARSAWQLLDERGLVREELVLRSRAGAGGVRILDWQDHAAESADALADVDASLSESSAAAGPWGPSCWVWPDIPEDRRLRCRPPVLVASVLSRVVPPGIDARYDRPLVWVQVPLPAGTRGVASALQHVAVNCAAVSNLEPFNERLSFGPLGTTVTFRPEGSATRHAVAVLGVTGEQGGRYADNADLDGGEAGIGRYRWRGADLQCRPARGPTGRLDRYAMIRLLYTDGERGNQLEQGDVRRFGAVLANALARVRNVVASRGGEAPPAYAGAKVRFAELLRTRERVVTAADIEASVRALEPRVQAIGIDNDVELAPDGARRVTRVRVHLRPSDFADPDAELPRVAALVEQHLQHRVPLGTVVRVIAVTRRTW